MTVACPCSQKLRIELRTAHRARCPICRRMVGAEAVRQAERNAAIVLEVAAYLAHLIDTDRMTPADDAIGAIFHRHETGASAAAPAPAPMSAAAPIETPATPDPPVRIVRSRAGVPAHIAIAEGKVKLNASV